MKNRWQRVQRAVWLVAGALLPLFFSACEHTNNQAFSETDTNIVTLTKGNFREQVLASPQPVLVDFWATWCGPCKVLAPTIHELAAEYAGRVKFGKLDIDQHESVADQFSVEAYPTVLLFKDGKVVDRMIGIVEKKVLQEKLEQLVASTAPAVAKPAGTSP